MSAPPKSGVPTLLDRLLAWIGTLPPIVQPVLAGPLLFAAGVGRPLVFVPILLLGLVWAGPEIIAVAVRVFGAGLVASLAAGAAYALGRQLMRPFGRPGAVLAGVPATAAFAASCALLAPWLTGRPSWVETAGTEGWITLGALTVTAGLTLGVAFADTPAVARRRRRPRTQPRVRTTGEPGAGSTPRPPASPA